MGDVEEPRTDRDVPIPPPRRELAVQAYDRRAPRRTSHIPTGSDEAGGPEAVAQHLDRVTERHPSLRNLAIALDITTDSLVFDPTERGPSDGLALHLEAIGQLNPDDQHLIRNLIEAILPRHDTRRWTQAS